MKNYYLNTKRFRRTISYNIIRVVISSVITVFVLLGIACGIVWHYRLQVFDLLAKNLSRDVTPQTAIPVSGGSTKITMPAEIIRSNGTVVDAVKIAKPAVVSVIVSKNVPTYNVTYQQQDLSPGISIQSPIYTPNGTEKKEVGSGSGFIISANGLIVTNRHVVVDKDAMYDFLLNNGKKYSAKVLARDSALDVAILKIEVTDLPHLSFADSDALEVGQSVIAIGNALGEFKNSVSVGVVSGLSRSIVAGDNAGMSELLDKVIQTDAAINPGNSGGPLLNLAGQVVGINVATVIGSSSVGFSIPINSVKSIINSVIKTGIIVRPYVGIRYIAITPEIKSKLTLPVDYGILIEKGDAASDVAVIPGSPADKAGIVEGDIILEVNSQKIHSDLASVIRGKKVGDSILCKVLSGGTEKSVTIKLEQAPSDM